LKILKTAREAKEDSALQASNKMLEKQEIKKRGITMKTETVKPISYNTIKRNTCLNRFFEKEEESRE